MSVMGDRLPTPKTTLVLGGGGARGYAHLGVLQVLEEAGIHVDKIVGVSIGALMGALYCHEPDAHLITNKVRDYVTAPDFRRYYNRMLKASQGAGQGGESQASELAETPRLLGNLVGRVRHYVRATVAFHRFVSRPGILSNRPMEACLEALLPPQNIEDLAVPLTIVAADLINGCRVDLTQGELHSAIVGSSAIPGIFPPTKHDDLLLADYGVICPLPLEDAESNHCVIGVDISPPMNRMDAFESGMDVMNRMEAIGCQVARDRLHGQADLIIRPQLDGNSWADFLCMDEILEAGRAAAKSSLSHIEKLRNEVRH